MDRKYGNHVWCRVKTNIKNDFNLAFCKVQCLGHLQCCNDKCEHLFFNGCNNEIIWTGDIVLHLKQIILVCHSTKFVPPLLILLTHVLHACITLFTINVIGLEQWSILVHMTIQRLMGGVESLSHKSNSCWKMRFHTPFTTNFAIVLITNQKFLSLHLLNEDGDDHVELFWGDKLNQVMDKFAEFYFPNIRNLISSLKHRLKSQDYIFKIMACKYKSEYDYIQNIQLHQNAF